MGDSVRRYSQIGIIQWMSYSQGDPMEPLKAICKDDLLDATELKGYGYESKETKRLLEQSHLKICCGVQPRLPDGKSDPNDLGEGDRKKAEATLIEAVDEAEYLGTKEAAFLVGKWQPETKEQACIQLLETTRAICDYFAEKGMTVELEVFDYDMDKTTFIGPTFCATEFATGIRTIHSNFGLLVDLSHSPTTYETSRFVIRTSRPYIAHFHFGDVAVVKDCDGYGDLHPRFGYPNSVSDTPQLLDYLRVMKERGLFDTGNSYVLSMEVTLYPGEDEDIVLTNTKGVLKWVWALLEDSA